MELANSNGTAIEKCSSLGKHSKELEFIEAQNEKKIDFKAKKQFFVETK